MQLDLDDATSEAVRAFLAGCEMFPPTELPDKEPPNNKWLLSSGVQKAVRQGRQDLAMSAAARLCTIDTTYILRRLAVIAAEDCLACCATTGFFVVMAAGKAGRKAYGFTSEEDFVIRSAGVLACILPFRGADDLSAYANFAPDMEDVRQIMWSEKGDVLYEILKGEQYPLAARAMAAVNIGGVRQGHDFLPPSHARNAILERLDSEYDELPRLYAQLSRKYCYENQAKMFPLIYALRWTGFHDEWWDIESMGRPRDQIPEINGVLASAMDYHTREGKIAFAYFRKACEPLAKLLSKVEPHLRAPVVGMSIFALEGRAVQEGAVFGARHRKLLYDETQRGFYTYNESIDDVLGMDIAYTIADNLDKLDYARQRTYKG